MENKKCQALVSELITKYLAFYICDSSAVTQNFIVSCTTDSYEMCFCGTLWPFGVKMWYKNSLFLPLLNIKGILTKYLYYGINYTLVSIN